MKGKVQKMLYGYKLKFYVRENENSNLIIKRFFIQSKESDHFEAGTVEMLKYIKRYDYYSCKLISCEPLK